MYDIVSAIEISILYDMIPYNISAWHDICMQAICWDMMSGRSIIVMRVYDIKTRYISIIWCISAIWYICMTWHDSSMIWYSVSNLGSWYHDFSVFWPFSVLALRCSGVRCLGFSPNNAVILKRLKLRAISKNKKSKILSRGSFSSPLVRNDTTQL